MADALVSVVLEQLISIVGRKLQDELKLYKGVKTNIQKLITDFQTIRAVLDDADKRRVKDDDVQIWVDRLKDICYDMEDVLDEWRTAAILKQQQLQPPESASSLKNKVRSFWTSSHLPWFNRTVWKRNIALKIKDLNQRLDEVVKDKDRYNFKFITGTTPPQELERPKTTSFVDVSHTHGRDSVKQSLIGRLLSESSQEEHNLTVTAIVGMGGIGKTTLAQLAFNDESVKKHFEKQIWVCVSQPFNIIHIARAILEGLDIKDRDPTELESMLQVICKALDNQRFLLVLDDVWNEDNKKWEPLRNCLKSGAQGSKILVTTRSDRVADIMEASNPIHLEELSAEECWSIFSKIAFSGRSKEECKVLEEIGRKISERCRGLPLAAKVLGGLMRFKKRRVEWQNVFESDLWKQEGVDKELDSVFMLSYYDLPSPMKRCFTYCAIFPEDDVFERDCLIQLWMANGFLKGREMEITGEEYLESLAMRSLFQDLERDVSGRIKRCKMHDLVREFALRVSGNECSAIEVCIDKEKPMKQELSSYAKLYHVRLISKGGDHLSSALLEFSFNGLRTLAITTNLRAPHSGNVVLSSGLFYGLTSLRALELSWSDIQELPEEIGNLMHLRYLGLEDSRRFEALPETVCDLFNLQTLKLNLCFSIKRLPREIGKLLNLRHLEFAETGITKLPKGVGELTSLRTLREVDCSNHDNSEEEEEEYFGIGDLEKLNCLEYLSLYGLGSVELLNDVVAGEAKRAELKNKKNLRKLVLSFDEPLWRDDDEEEEERAKRAKRHLFIAEALLEELPPHLEILKLQYCKGTEFPRWMPSPNAGLKSLVLRNCPNLKELPRDFFERLPLLRRLGIYYCSPALGEHCRRRITENSALASLTFIIKD